MRFPERPQPEVPEPAQQTPTWQSSIGGSFCPNGHLAPFEAKHCPTCGVGPVPGFVDRESHERTNRLGTKGGF